MKSAHAHLITHKNFGVYSWNYVLKNLDPCLLNDKLCLHYLVCIEKFLGALSGQFEKIGQDPSVSKSYRLHADIPQFFFILFSYILHISLK